MTKQASALILEDEPIVAFALEDMLFELGFEEVRLATTLEAAFDYLEARAPDVAVLDVNIRGQRSYGFAEKLSGSGVPFLFATGYGDAEHPEALRATPTLTKPYNQDELKAVLATLTDPQ
jgi:CheY-like chemotaxis protein